MNLHKMQSEMTMVVADLIHRQQEIGAGKSMLGKPDAVFLRYQNDDQFKWDVRKAVAVLMEIVQRHGFQDVKMLVEAVTIESRWKGPESMDPGPITVIPYQPQQQREDT